MEEEKIKEIDKDDTEYISGGSFIEVNVGGINIDKSTTDNTKIVTINNGTIGGDIIMH